MEPVSLNILKDYCTDEQFSGILRALTVLNDHGFTMISQILEDEIALSMATPSAVAENLIQYRLMPLMKEYTNSMGVVVHPEIGLTELSNLLFGLLQIEFYEDKASLYEILDDAEDNVEALLDVLGRVTIYPAQYFEPLIDEVRGSLIDKLVELCTPSEGTPETLYTTVEYQRAKERVKRFLAHLKEKDPVLAAEHLDTQLFKLGVDNLALAQLHADALEDMPEAQAVAQLCLMAVASKFEDQELVQVLKQYVEVSQSDIVRATSIGRKAQALLLEVKYG